MKVHFIGIGGIGVSALAQYYLSKGADVSGSDLVSSEITEMLQEKGAKIVFDHKRENVPKESLIIYSPAVEESNPEYKVAKELKLELLSYPEALGKLTKEYYTIAVSGAHGKSTTTSMVALILKEAGLDPTVIVGTKLKEFGNANFREGKSKYLVIEADEWNASFLNYWPKIIVLTNIEREHLDYYKNLENILKTFKKYISHLPKDGILIANKDSEHVHKVIQGITNLHFYSLDQREAKDIKLNIPGKHNISNALAALTVARVLNIKDEVSLKALSEYKGSWRRFDVSEKIINGKTITLVNDYGHHPTEVRVTLEAAREKYKDKRIYCVFQPHQYQRTYNLFDDFVKVFQEAKIDLVAITDIYSVAGREKEDIKRKVNSEMLVKTVNRDNIIYLSKDKIVSYLKENVQDFDVLMLMGAGDIYEVNKEI